MRNLLLFLLLFLAYPSFAQQQASGNVPRLPLNGSFVEYTGTVTPELHIGKAKLFSNALKWYKYNFQSSDNTLTIDKFDSGKLSGTGIIHQRRREKQILPG